MLAPISVPELEREVQAAAERELAFAVGELDHDVSVTTFVTACCLRRALVRAWRCGEHDAVVLAASGPLSPLAAAARAMRRVGVEPIVVGADAPRRQVGRPRRRPRLTRRARPA
jgi:hypothetical protein